MNTNIIASTPNISGNIGSCEIKSTNTNIDSFTTRTIALNSCTGQIVSDVTYHDYGSITLIGVCVVVAFTFIVMLIKTIFE